MWSIEIQSFTFFWDAPHIEVFTIRRWEDLKASSLMAPMDISMEVEHLVVSVVVASWYGSENGEIAT